MLRLVSLLAAAAAAASACATNDHDVRGDGVDVLAAPDAGPVDGIVPSIVASSVSLSVNEGTFGMLRVRLSAPPAIPVTLTATPHDDQIRLSSSELVFTAADFDLDRMIVVSALDDVDLLDGHSAVQLSAPGLASVVVSVAIDDTDVQSL